MVEILASKCESCNKTTFNHNEDNWICFNQLWRSKAKKLPERDDNNGQPGTFHFCSDKCFLDYLKKMEIIK